MDFQWGPRDTGCFEMQILTYAQCPSQASPPIDRLKQIPLISEYLIGIIKSLLKVLRAHFHFSGSHSPPTPCRLPPTHLKIQRAAQLEIMANWVKNSK